MVENFIKCEEAISRCWRTAWGCLFALHTTMYDSVGEKNKA